MYSLLLLVLVYGGTVRQKIAALVHTQKLLFFEIVLNMLSGIGPTLTC